MAEPIETGWLATTPPGDNLFRRFALNQAEMNAEVAVASGGTSTVLDGLAVADAGSVVPYFNQVVCTRPLAVDDAALRGVTAALDGGSGRAATLLSIYPTPDLGPHGWALIGHPVLVARSPGPVGHTPKPGVEVVPATTPTLLAEAEAVVVEGYPIEEAVGAPAGAVLSPGTLDTGLLVRVGRLDGAPVAVGARYVAHDVVNLCIAATLPAARRRGVWQAIVWARVSDAPDAVAMAFTSDYSRPGFVRMGFLPITRCTLWFRAGTTS